MLSLTLDARNCREGGEPCARKTAIRWLATLTVGLCAAVGLPGAMHAMSPAKHVVPAPSGEPVVVLAAGDLRGEIKPCGCSPEGQMGGLPRRLSYLQRQFSGKGPRPILVDLGNNFPAPSEQGQLKIELIQKLLSRFPPDAILPGPNELAVGLSALSPTLPWVVSNETGSRLFRHYRTVTRQGQRIGLYGYLSPKLVYQGPQVGFTLEPVDGRLLKKLGDTIDRERQDRTVLLFRGSDDELALFLRSGLFGAIIAGNPSSDELKQVTQRVVAGVRVPQVPTKGQGVERLLLPPHPAKPRQGVVPRAWATTVATARVDWLKEDLPDHPDAIAAFKTYDERVKALFFSHLRLKEQRGTESPFVGAAVCKSCHPSAYQRWSESRHAHALATLERVGKQFDPECLACHVVGLERNGFLSKDLTPQLANVQCENCHGSGRAHAADPQVKMGPAPETTGTSGGEPDERTCRTCHRGSHSPHFNFSVYWPKISHGLSGQLAPAATDPATSTDSR